MKDFLVLFIPIYYTVGLGISIKVAMKRNYDFHNFAMVLSMFLYAIISPVRLLIWKLLKR